MKDEEDDRDDDDGDDEHNSDAAADDDGDDDADDDGDAGDDGDDEGDCDGDGDGDDADADEEEDEVEFENGDGDNDYDDDDDDDDDNCDDDAGNGVERSFASLLFSTTRITPSPRTHIIRLLTRKHAHKNTLANEQPLSESRAPKGNTKIWIVIHTTKQPAPQPYVPHALNQVQQI